MIATTMNITNHVLQKRARRDLERFYTVPVDGRCLSEASEVAENYQLATTHGIHLAAAVRLGAEVGYLTLSEAQFGPAEHLGLQLAVRTRSEQVPNRVAAMPRP